MKERFTGCGHIIDDDDLGPGFERRAFDELSFAVGFGLLAPPVGLNVYVVNGLAKDVPISESYKGVMPFLISDTIRTTFLLFFPGISLWLVKYIS